MKRFPGRIASIVAVASIMASVSQGKDSHSGSSVLAEPPTTPHARYLGATWLARSVPDGVQSYKKNIVLYPGVVGAVKNWSEASPCLLLAEDWIKEPGGFEPHPHRGFVTVSILFRGALRHTDYSRRSKGNTAVVRGLDVQVMTTGKGIVHSEMPEGSADTHMLQLWLNLPSKSKMMEPFHEDITAKSIPVLDLGHGYACRVLTGSLGEPGTSSPARMAHPLLILDITRGGLDGGIPRADGAKEGPGAAWLEAAREKPISESDQAFVPEVQVPAGWNGFAYAVHGGWDIVGAEGGGDPSILKHGHAGLLPPVRVAKSASVSGALSRASGSIDGRVAAAADTTEVAATGSTGAIAASSSPSGSAGESEPPAESGPAAPLAAAGAGEDSGRSARVPLRLRLRGGGTKARAPSDGKQGRVVVFLGPAIDEPVVARGPFVMNSEDGIQQAIADYRAGKF